MSEVIRKSAVLLNALSSANDPDKEGWSATDLSRQVNMSVQTVHRLLSSLEKYGAVVKNHKTKKYTAGLSLLKLGLSIKDHSSIRNSAYPAMEQIARQTGCTVCLTVFERDEGICIECVHPLQLFLDKERIGMRSALNDGAANKVILAHKSSEKRTQIIQSLLQKGQVQDLKLLETELSIIKKCGISIGFDESESGYATIAAPVFARDSSITAAVNVFFPYPKLEEEEISKVMDLIEKAATSISKKERYVSLSK